MFLTAKLNLISGVIIGAASVLVMKQMCKDRKKQTGTSATVETKINATSVKERHQLLDGPASVGVSIL